MGSISNLSKDTALLRARIEDTVRLADKRQFAAFLGFLDEREQAEVEQILCKLSVTNFRFYGGFDDSERCLLGVFADAVECDNACFPVRVAAFYCRADKKLTHRDVLGTLMAMGLRRDAIGDILCDNGLAVVFLREEIFAYVCEQVEKIGGEAVRVEQDYDGVLPVAHTFSELRDTIASARLDAVVSALVRCSRDRSAQLIRSDSVSVNRVPVGSVSHSVVVGSTVTVRGHGKFIIDELGPETKKGRLRFTARKYL